MDILKRELAPISPAAWKQIDDEACRVLKLHLAGRKLVDFRGPLGWCEGAVNSGRYQLLTQTPAPEVKAALRIVQPLIEVRTPIILPIAELDMIERGALDIDLDPVIQAAERVARAEDGAVFHGFAPGLIHGIIEESPHAPVPVAKPADWPAAIVRAKEVLRAAGVSGPYALALGKKAYDELSSGSEDGYPLRKRIERTLIDGPFVWAPAIKGGAVLLSMRGGDFELTVGQDASIGYVVHDKINVELYLTETFTFRVLEDKPAVFLKRP